MLDAGLVVGEGLGAVEAVDGAVEGLVGLEEIGRHKERIVELGEGGVGVAGAGVEDEIFSVRHYASAARSSQVDTAAENLEIMSARPQSFGATR